MNDTNSIDKIERFMNEVRLLSACLFAHVVGIHFAVINGIFQGPYGQKRTVVYHVTSYAKYGELYRIVRETEHFKEPLARTYILQLLKGKYFCVTEKVWIICIQLAYRTVTLSWRIYY